MFLNPNTDPLAVVFFLQVVCDTANPGVAMRSSLLQVLSIGKNSLEIVELVIRVGLLMVNQTKSMRIHIIVTRIILF